MLTTFFLTAIAAITGIIFSSKIVKLKGQGQESCINTSFETFFGMPIIANIHVDHLQ